MSFLRLVTVGISFESSLRQTTLNIYRFTIPLDLESFLTFNDYNGGP